MTKKILFITLLTYFALQAKSQTNSNYEYGVVIYSGYYQVPKKYTLTLNTDNSVKELEGKLENGNIFNNILPLIEQCNLLSKEGWEVFSTNYLTSPATYMVVYNLRRIKKE